MLASLVFDVVLSIPADQRRKPMSVLCTDTRVEIPAIADMIEGALDRMRKCSQQHSLNIEASLLKPKIEESFWVNIIGRGYPPPNRTFRWCTQRMKIDPVNVFVKQRVGHWGEAILHLGARRAESSTRAQTMAARATRNGLRRHPDLPRVWVSNPIEFLTTEDVWAYLLQNTNPWGGDNRPLYKLYGAGAEFPHAWLKAKIGLRQFRVRGLKKVRCEALWACLAYNLSQWIRLCWRVQWAGAEA